MSDDDGQAKNALARERLTQFRVGRVRENVQATATTRAFLSVRLVFKNMNEEEEHITH